MKKESINFLEYKPQMVEIPWSEKDGIVILEIENKGLMNKIAQKLFKKPKVSYIHLDEMGSFIWPKLNGELTVLQLGELVKEHFGDDAEPLYERLSKYISILNSYGFVSLN